MRERTNTSQFTLKPTGHYVLTVAGVPEKRSNGKFRIWKFQYIKAGFDAEMSIIMFPWKSKELLLAVGGKDVGNNEIDWDDEQVNGKQIECDLIHEEDKAGVMREVLTNIIPYRNLPESVESVSHYATTNIKKTDAPTPEEQEAWDQ